MQFLPTPNCQFPVPNFQLTYLQSLIQFLPTPSCRFPVPNFQLTHLQSSIQLLPTSNPGFLIRNSQFISIHTSAPTLLTNAFGMTLAIRIDLFDHGCLELLSRCIHPAPILFEDEDNGSDIEKGRLES